MEGGNEEDGENQELEYAIEHEHRKGGFEGDIQLNAKQAAMIKNETGEALRSAIKDERNKWPRVGAYVHVPYVINRQSRYSKLEMDNINLAFKEYEKYTCIRYKR